MLKFNQGQIKNNKKTLLLVPENQKKIQFSKLINIKKNNRKTWKRRCCCRILLPLWRKAPRTPSTSQRPRVTTVFRGLWRHWCSTSSKSRFRHIVIHSISTSKTFMRTFVCVVHLRNVFFLLSYLLFFIKMIKL